MAGFSFWMWPHSHRCTIKLRCSIRFMAGILLLLANCLQGARSELFLANDDLGAKWEWGNTEGSVHLLSFFSLEHYFCPFLFPLFNFELIFLQLLRKCPERRLGAGEKDAEEIKIQPFFKVGTCFIPLLYFLCLSWERFVLCWYWGLFSFVIRVFLVSVAPHCSIQEHVFQVLLEMTSPKSVFWDLYASRASLFLIVLLLCTNVPDFRDMNKHSF